MAFSYHLQFLASLKSNLLVVIVVVCSSCNVSGPSPPQVVHSGEVLLEGPAFASAREVVANTASLRPAWADLLASVARKREALGLSLKAQQFYFEVGEIESWIGEKAQTLKG